IGAPARWCLSEKKLAGRVINGHDAESPGGHKESGATENAKGRHAIESRVDRRAYVCDFLSFPSRKSPREQSPRRPRFTARRGTAEEVDSRGETSIHSFQFSLHRTPRGWNCVY